MSAVDAVRSYKNLSRAERAFRTLKSIDLKIRPIFHWTSNRIKSHVLLCMLAYYVEWHMKQALAPMLFEDDSGSAKKLSGRPREAFHERYAQNPHWKNIGGVACTQLS